MYESESDMLFIKEPQNEICEIEKTELYKKLISSNGVKTVEYLRTHRMKDNRQALTWIEAKTTFANPRTNQNFESQINEISEKFAQSLELFAAVMMNKLPDSEFEFEMFRRIFSEAQFQMILVIKKYKTEWLQPVADALHKKLKRHWKIWNLNPNRDILVLNEELAIKFRLIQQKTEN